MHTCGVSILSSSGIQHSHKLTHFILLPPCLQVRAPTLQSCSQRLLKFSLTGAVMSRRSDLVQTGVSSGNSTPCREQGLWLPHLTPSTACSVSWSPARTELIPCSGQCGLIHPTSLLGTRDSLATDKKGRARGQRGAGGSRGSHLPFVHYVPELSISVCSCESPSLLHTFVINCCYCCHC